MIYFRRAVHITAATKSFLGSDHPFSEPVARPDIDDKILRASGIKTFLIYPKNAAGRARRPPLFASGAAGAAAASVAATASGEENGGTTVREKWIFAGF